MSDFQETTVNVLAEGTQLEGRITLDRISRVHGILKGEVSAKDGSTLILCETSTVEGIIQADVLMIDGFVQGDIFAKNRVVISRTGRVIGTIHTPSLKIEFGGYFEGRCRMGKESSGKDFPVTSFS